ncbi:MAG TPA: hypothetical protein C5S37_04650 [Methanophagales archaeon]|nr:hypothetical protein [Methanophagales archaeon]
MEIYPKGKYEEALSEAEKISPHSQDIHKDDPYFALALSFNAPIWSDEKAFKKQSVVEVFSTSDLISFLSEI